MAPAHDASIEVAKIFAGTLRQMTQQMVHAVERSTAETAKAIAALAERPINVSVEAPKPRNRTITTRRDEKGNLVASVSDDEEGE